MLEVDVVECGAEWTATSEVGDDKSEQAAMIRSRLSVVHDLSMVYMQ